MHDCTQHPPSATCYQKHKCRCDGCKREQSRYAKRRRVSLSQGRSNLVDAGPVRDHVERLMALGMSHGTIAVKAGLPNSGLQALLGLKSNAKRLTRIRRDRAEQILAVTFERAVGGNLVPATASRRRLQDLGLRGFAARELSTLSGIERQTICDVRSGKRLLVFLATAEAFERVHDDLAGRSPGTRNWKAMQKFAIASGWKPLAAFDDINNEKERPKGVAS